MIKMMKFIENIFLILLLLLSCPFVKSQPYSVHGIQKINSQVISGTQLPLIWDFPSPTIDENNSEDEQLQTNDNNIYVNNITSLWSSTSTLIPSLSENRYSVLYRFLTYFQIDLPPPFSLL